jgi:antitoxin component HigA of HigAB toxin-antitoxin module
MKGTKKAVRFDETPKDYAGLCKLLLPRPIHDQQELENVSEMAQAMAGHKLSRDQADYFDLLCKLIEEYEKEEIPAAKASGLEVLRHLLAEQGMSGGDLSRLLGVHRTLGPMILRGERKLTVEHIRILSAYFSVSADLFFTDER